VAVLDRYQALDPEKLDLAAEARLLDVGCGTGRHLLEQSHSPGLLVGLDMSSEELRKTRYMLHLTARERGIKAEVHLVQGAGERLPFPDGHFGQVICTETLEHVPDDQAVLPELVRVLRPGGVLAVSVPDEYSERLLWRLSPRYRNHPGGHVRIYRREEIARLLREAGAAPFAVEFRHSLESVRWLVHAVVDREWGKPGLLTRGIRWLLDTPSHRDWRLLAWCDALGNHILPKSIVLYGRKLGHG
jgi:ubiquinone/menaquinone biosynthesis C-methylase UbiE